MGWDAIAAIAIQTQGCLGYWGYSDEDASYRTLSDLVVQTELGNWQRGSLLTLGDSQIALSASGVDADAWVSIYPRSREGNLTIPKSQQAPALPVDSWG